MKTALIVPIPEAEEAVAQWRVDLDSAAALGVPAHVTVLFPFLDHEEVTAEALTAIAETVAQFPTFATTFSRTAWFDDRVLYLAPTPDEPFRSLTQAVWRKFPQHPPYAGAHADVVPHLTIGHDHPGPDLRKAEEAVAPLLPISAAVSKVVLISEAADWQPIADFRLK